MYEIADGRRGEHHHAHRQHHRRDHHGEMARHADGGDHRVEREDDVEQHDLPDDAAERGACASPGMVRIPFQPLMNLARAFRDQEEAAADENQVAAGERMAQQMKQRRSETDDPGERGEQRDAHDHRARQADATGTPLLLTGKLARQDGDEDDVVDAEDDLEHRQREQAQPRFGT